MNYADQWNRQIEAKTEGTENAVELEFAGLKGLFRRLSIAGWLKTGKLPYFVIEILNGIAEKGEDASAALVSKDDFERGREFQRSVVMAVTAEPKIVDHNDPLNPGEVRYSDLAFIYPDAVDQIVAWVIAGSPEIPVQMVDGTKGNLTDVKNFRNRKQRRMDASVGSKVSKVRRKAL
jgi:hypothetical protein